MYEEEEKEARASMFDLRRARRDEVET